MIKHFREVKENNAMLLEKVEGRTKNQSDHINTTQGYNKEQYNKFVQMFKQMKIEEASQGSAGSKINSNAMAGTILKYIGSCFSALKSNT